MEYGHEEAAHRFEGKDPREFAVLTKVCIFDFVLCACACPFVNVRMCMRMLFLSRGERARPRTDWKEKTRVSLLCYQRFVYTTTCVFVFCASACAFVNMRMCMRVLCL